MQMWKNYLKINIIITRFIKSQSNISLDNYMSMSFSAYTDCSINMQSSGSFEYKHYNILIVFYNF